MVPTAASTIWRAHLFPLTELKGWLWIPLPGLGSLYPLLRGHVLHVDQDMKGSANVAMWAHLRAALEPRTGNRPLLLRRATSTRSRSCARVHSTTCWSAAPGPKTRSRPVGSGPDTVFAHEHPGFLVVDVHEGQFLISVVEPIDGGDAVIATLPVMPATP